MHEVDGVRPTTWVSVSTRSAVTDNCELAFAQWHPGRGKMSNKARLDKHRPTAEYRVGPQVD